MIETVEKKKLVCYHCGDSCTSDEIHSGGNYFCCEGCKTVYEILNENSLCDYYSLENTPGNKVESRSTGSYEFLNEERIADQLFHFKEGDLRGVTFYIPSIHCSSCIWLLENLHKIQPGVIRSSISFQKKEVEFQFDKTKVSLAQIARLLDRLGYPPEITLEGKTVSQKTRNKSLFYKIGIAGFCFGNIMLLSIPEYVSFLHDFNGEFRTFFSYLNFLLALPVFFYSASDYFLSAWNAIKNKIINIDLPIALALTAAFIQSLIEIVSQTGMGYLDSLTGLVFFLLIGKWYQQRTYEAISFQRDYKSYFPLVATLISDGKEVFVPLNELKKGDLILLRNQDVIPADGIVREGKARIDYSFVTGESLPVPKKTGEQVFAGGRQTGESIRVEVSRKVSESYLTQLWNKDHSSRTPTSLTEFTNKVGKYFTIAVLLIALGTYLFWYGKDPSLALYAAITVLIIFCPCTLALAIPFCFGNAMNILGKNGFYLKNTETIERLDANDAIVFDKTGTITCSGSSEIKWSGSLTDKEMEYVKSLVKNSGHPLSRMLSEYLKVVRALPVNYFKEEVSKGVEGTVDGKEIRVGSLEFAASGYFPEKINNETRVYVSINGQLKGFYTFRNKYRPGIQEVLLKLGKKYKLHLLSGDNDGERDRLSGLFSPGNMQFNQSPSDKLNYIKALSKNRKVIMIGDGLNDAGALLESNCGISVSDSNTNFSPACDAILEAGKMIKLPQFISYSRACMKTVRLSLLISLTYNLIGLFFACQGILKPLTAAILMPLSSVSIVLFVTLLSNLLARKYSLK